MPRKLPTADKKLLLLVAVILGIVIILVAWMGINYMTLMQMWQEQRPIQPEPTPTEYKASLPVQFTISDFWGGGSPGATSVTVYKYGTLEQYDSGTADATTGIWTTNKAFKTGERYWVYCSLSNAKIYYDVTIPYATTTGQTKHYINLDFYDLGTFAFVVTDPEGDAFSSGGSYNVSASGNTKYPSFTVMIRNSEDDSGIMDYYDPVKAFQRQTLFYFKLSGTYSNEVVVKNVPNIYSVSATEKYYGFTVSSSELVRDLLPDGTYKSEGIYSFSIALDCSGLTTGQDNGAVLTLYLKGFTNLDHYSTYGTHPTGAYTLISAFTINIDS